MGSRAWVWLDVPDWQRDLETIRDGRHGSKLTRHRRRADGDRFRLRTWALPRSSLQVTILSPGCRKPSGIATGQQQGRSTCGNYSEFVRPIQRLQLAIEPRYTYI